MLGDFILVEDVAMDLNMTQAAVRAVIRRGELPAYKVGKEWRIRKDDLAEFIASARVKPDSETKEDTRRKELQRTKEGSLEVERALRVLKDVVSDMASEDSRERLISYGIIKTIISDLDDVAARSEIPIGNYIIYKHELTWSCEAICDLNGGNGHSATEHVSWALNAIGKLGSFACFNCK
jgi:excisionase family DNA binding protein